MQKPLEGIRVVDWTIWQFGPTATVMLADLGAEVIKVEQRGPGDPGRGISALGSLKIGRPSFYWEACNRHKKSIAVDLKTPMGREIVLQLVQRSDVFVQNFRKGVADRLGLGYEALRTLNPRLIYASGSGYGPDGPDSAEPAFDYLGQARSGFMYESAVPDEHLPAYVTGGIADQMGAIMLAYGVMVALVVRERHGIGQRVDTSHLGAMVALQGLTVTAAGIHGRAMSTPTREGAVNALWNHYMCQDGKWFALGMIQSDRYWKDLCELVGRPDLASDPRFADAASRTHHRFDVIAELDKVFRTKPRAEWLEILRRDRNLVFGPVNRIEDLIEDPQAIANEYVVDYEHPDYGTFKLAGLPLRFSQTPGDARGRAPELGEHTEEILTETLGYTWEQIHELRESGVI